MIDKDKLDLVLNPNVEYNYNSTTLYNAVSPRISATLKIGHNQENGKTSDEHGGQNTSKNFSSTITMTVGQTTMFHHGINPDNTTTMSLSAGMTFGMINAGIDANSILNPNNKTLTFGDNIGLNTSKCGNFKLSYSHSDTGIPENPTNKEDKLTIEYTYKINSNKKSQTNVVPPEEQKAIEDRLNEYVEGKTSDTDKKRVDEANKFRDKKYAAMSNWK